MQVNSIEVSPTDEIMGKTITDLRSLATSSLHRMYRPEEKLFVFRIRRQEKGIATEGLSYRYTAIALIGLAGEDKSAVAAVLGTHSPAEVCHGLAEVIGNVSSLGDVALALWAAKAFDYPGQDNILERLIQLRPVERTYPTVEAAWALDSLCGQDSSPSELLELLAQRLIDSFNRRSGMFPHMLDSGKDGLRSHISCFADLVYPIHALCNYFRVSGDKIALETASLCASRICSLQGPRGQWWWHYDYRTGNVTEGYPVYAVHQDAMAPMAMLALRDAGGPDFSTNINRGLDWLEYSHEISGSLIDRENGIVWRKVARKEPRKLTRYIQAFASRIHSNLILPGMDVVFPPVEVDWESRPYHMGWILYAWSRK